MKKEKIIIELENILNEGDDYIALQNMNKLIDTLKKDLILENCKKTTKTSKINAIKKVLNNKINEVRPILKKYNIVDDKMCFTDSYQAYRINQIDSNPFEKVGDGENYPSLDYIFNSQYKIAIEENKIDLTYAEIKTNCKLKKDTYINGKHFDSNYILNMLDILEEEKNIYLNKEANIIYAIDEKQQEAIVIGFYK